jgi:hypothetical protein
LVIVLSFVVVLALNASTIKIYGILAADPAVSQAIAAKASAAVNQVNSNSGTLDLTQTRKNISDELNQYPVLLRTSRYPNDLKEDPAGDIGGLIVMGLLVTLGAPFWNDVLNGITGDNNRLNAGGKKRW